METSSIFAFVLALLVAGNVALAWIIYATRREMQGTASSLSTIASAFAKWRDRLTQLQSEHSAKLVELAAQSPVELGVRVVELADAVERLRKTHQRFAGRVSQELGADPRPDNSPPTIDRDELRRAHAKDIMPAGVRK
jgi:hypothetical protein